MLHGIIPTITFVNRHTGGLENTQNNTLMFAPVNRHTGGLEKQVLAAIQFNIVNCHKGGLETAA